MTVTESLPSDVQPVARTTLMLTMVSGVCALIIGILILVWPETTLLVVAILFGIQLLVSGVMRIIGGAVDSSAEGWKRGLLITLGVLIVLAGIFCLRNPALSLLTIILVVAVGWLVDGILTLVLGFQNPPGNGWDLSCWGSSFFSGQSPCSSFQRRPCSRLFCSVAGSLSPSASPHSSPGFSDCGSCGKPADLPCSRW